jgi:hypothetical protein
MNATGQFLAHVNSAVRKVALVREFAVDESSGAVKVARAANNGVLTRVQFVRVRTRKGELSVAAVEINVGTLAHPVLAVVEARAEFKVTTDGVGVGVVDSTRVGPRLTGVGRGSIVVRHPGAVGFENGVAPLLRVQKKRRVCVR